MATAYGMRTSSSLMALRSNYSQLLMLRTSSLRSTLRMRRQATVPCISASMLPIETPSRRGLKIFALGLRTKTVCSLFRHQAHSIRSFSAKGIELPHTSRNILRIGTAQEDYPLCGYATAQCWSKC